MRNTSIKNNRNSSKLLTLLLCIPVVAYLSSCSQTGGGINKTAIATATGAALGAGTGAIIGNQTGNAGEGVAIGAGLGALSGAVIGNSLDKRDKQQAELDSQLKQNQITLDENRRLIDELKRRGADAKVTDRGVVINLPDVLFEFDRSNLTRNASRTIDEITDVLRGNQRPVSIEGHTDSLGTVAYNKDLSVRRANSVARALGNRGISGARVSGFGEGAPIATNNTDAGRRRNRRVEIIIENN